MYLIFVREAVITSFRNVCQHLFAACPRVNISIFMITSFVTFPYKFSKKLSVLSDIIIISSRDGMESLTGFIEIISRTKSILGLGTAVCIIESGRISSKALAMSAKVKFLI